MSREHQTSKAKKLPPSPPPHTHTHKKKQKLEIISQTPLPRFTLPAYVAQKLTENNKQNKREHGMTRKKKTLVKEAPQAVLKVAL